MRKLLVTCTTSSALGIVTAGMQFEAVEHETGYYFDCVIDGLEFVGYAAGTRTFHIPCVYATFTYKVIEND